MSGMDTALRYCPICEQRYPEALCPKDGVLTVPGSTLHPRDLDLSAGTLIAGRYRIEARLGEGGMAAVYRATQVSMQRQVALKVMQPGLLVDAQAMKRFYREARAASALRHPHIVNVHEFGVDDGTHMPFIAMELVTGQSLKRLIQLEGPLPEPRACKLLAQIARALVEAHAKDVVHRDLKPDNVMVSTLEDGHEHVTVLDFGIAKVGGQAAEGQENLTASGVAIGTPRYMAPEQVLGQPVDFRADLYALGCILHEMLTRSVPYVADEMVKVMMMHVHGAVPELPATASAEARVLHQALLAKEPRLRPATTSVVARIATALATGAETEAAIWLAEAQVVAAEAATPRYTRPPEGVTDADAFTSDGIATTLRRPAGGLSAEPASASPPPQAKLPWLWILGGGAAGLMAVAFAVALRSSPTAEISAVPLPTPMEVTPPPKREPTPAPAPSPEPAEASVRIVSEPAGASVVLDGERLGVTPLDVSAADRSRALELRLSGHHTVRSQLKPGAKSPQVIRLRPRAKPTKTQDFPDLAPR